ncbi:MAG TPA: hypothetical protein VK741_21820 [Acetobacteraceae bacterium]|jgi:hypothetical protein|nr:hypothetical protein [Acetobacteraceae bacterium]
MSDVDRILKGRIESLLAVDNYSCAKAAASALPDVLSLDDLHRLKIPHTLPLIVLGLKAKAKMYRPDADDDEGSMPQSDFAAIERGFARLIRTPVALDEAHDTRRLPPIAMNRLELVQHISLKRRKARETNANAELLTRFVDAHPEWELMPDLTLGDILQRDLNSEPAA